MDKGMIKNYLKEHPIAEVSPAGIEYYIYSAPDIAEKARKNAMETVEQTDEDKEIAAAIAAAETGADAAALIRRTMTRLNMDALRDKLLAYQEELYPVLKEKCLTIGVDHAADHLYYFFLHCEEDPCAWIAEQLCNVRNDYMRSMLAMVLGLRGPKEAVQLLMDEANWQESHNAGTYLNQGPLIGIRELGMRFYRLEYKA